MNDKYFKRVNNQTNTRFWINNPTEKELRKAIEEGAISVTTNPTYVMKVMKDEAERTKVYSFIRTAKKTIKNENEIALYVQRNMAKCLMDIFLPYYLKNERKKGFVSVQVDPYSEKNPDMIIAEAFEDIKISQNAIIKVPATSAGLQAMEYLISKDIPIVATEIMAIAQALEVCELYKRVSSATGNMPPFYLTHITGIFDDYMKKLVAEKGISISSDVLWQAGITIARKQYSIIKEKNYPVIMLGGGARGLHHFTEFVGGDIHITINWENTADKLIELNPPVICRIDTPSPKHIVNELRDKIPDFARAYDEDGLKTEEYMDFGPVELFRSSFIKGWDYLIDIIRSS